MIYIWTAAGYLLSAVLLLLALPLIMIQNIFNNQDIFNPVIRFMCRLIPVFFGISVKAKGMEKLDPKKSYIFIANHVNIFDGFILYGYIPHFVRGVELEEHFSWPIWGAVTSKIGNIPISHKNHRSAVKSLKKASEALKSGVSLIMLPEGHRTRDGKLLPFMRGPFRLALETKTDIAPVVMKNAFRIKSVGSKLVRPGKMELLFGEPIPYESFSESTDSELRSRMYEIMRQMTDQT